MRLLLTILFISYMFSGCSELKEMTKSYKYKISTESFGWKNTNSFTEKDNCITFISASSDIKYKFCGTYQILYNTENIENK